MFWTFSELIEDLESKAISWGIKQIPSLIAQTILPSSDSKEKEQEEINKKLFGSYAKHK